MNLDRKKEIYDVCVEYGKPGSLRTVLQGKSTSRVVPARVSGMSQLMRWCRKSTSITVPIYQSEIGTEMALDIFVVVRKHASLVSWSRAQRLS